jgi:serine/threonine-protein kinase
VKVVDFGIAKAVGGDQEGQKVTKTGLVVGTPEFMSPEQLSGDTVDGRSDLYSLALVFYRMLTGKLPFEAATSQEMMIKRLIEEPSKLVQTRPDLTFPAGLQPVLDTALARSPVDRYQTVAKFAADVASVTGAAGGRSATASVPHTRSGRGDAEGKTQLMDASAGATKRISASTRRSFVPIAAGVVVVLAAGGAWMVLNGGSKASGNPLDSSHVSRDTAKRTPPRPRAGIDPAQAGAILDGLIESTPTVIRDSATKVFYTAGVGIPDQAFAACLIAQAERALGSRTAALQWAQRGLRLNSSLTSCQNVIQALRS